MADCPLSTTAAAATRLMLAGDGSSGYGTKVTDRANTYFPYGANTWTFADGDSLALLTIAALASCDQRPTQRTLIRSAPSASRA